MPQDGIYSDRELKVITPENKIMDPTEGHELLTKPRIFVVSRRCFGASIFSSDFANFFSFLIAALCIIISNVFLPVTDVEDLLEASSAFVYSCI
jgi:hypothetical protein